MGEAVAFSVDVMIALSTTTAVVLACAGQLQITLALHMS